jgi:hypothetical protein
MDLTKFAAPRSDQANSQDFIAGASTFTIAEVKEGMRDREPVLDISFAEFPRPWRPSKTALRILMHAWGKDSEAFIGKRLTLFRDADVKFGGQSVGGIRVSAVSGITRKLTLSLPESRGKNKVHIVEPLADDAPTSKPVSEIDLLRAEYKSADAERKAEILTEVKALEAAGGAE